jgi:hypothetical protein
LLWPIQPAQSGPIKESAIFAALVGSWVGAGEMISADGSKTEVKEVWTGQLSEETFTISGVRNFGDMEHNFTWEFHTHHDLIEGQFKISNPEVDCRFEAVLDPENRTITITTILGGGSTLIVTNQISADGKTITGTFQIVGQTGETANQGKVIHTKQE